MRRALLAILGVVVLPAVGLPDPAVSDEETGAERDRTARMTRSEERGFDVEVLVDGRPLPIRRIGGRRFVDAVPGADYTLRITNPLPARVAVALSVDGLNAIDARQSDAWDASKWLIRPYQTLTVSGWQVSTERARRFYFTTERDSYAARLGRPTDFGAIRAVFFRERGSPPVISPRPGPLFPARRENWGAPEPLRAPAAAESLRERRGGERSFEYDEGRAATGLGRSERREVDVVDVGLERLPVAEVEIRYAYPPSWYRPEPGPHRGSEPGTPSRGGSTEDLRFCPEPAETRGPRP